MADTLTNISLPKGQWVDLYDASGIAVGTKIKAQNVGQTRIHLVTSATEPDGTGFNTIQPSNDFFVNETGSSGEWARSTEANGSINVGETA